MDALGFDLYTQMLERTVAELRGEAVEDETSVSLNLGVDVAIPEDYIQDMGQRLRTYKRVFFCERRGHPLRDSDRNGRSLWTYPSVGRATFFRMQGCAG